MFISFQLFWTSYKQEDGVIYKEFHMTMTYGNIFTGCWLHSSVGKVQPWSVGSGCLFCRRAEVLCKNTDSKHFVLNKTINSVCFFFIRFAIGDYRDHFCLQSVSKCLHYPIVLEDLTAEVVSFQVVINEWIIK